MFTIPCYNKDHLSQQILSPVVIWQNQTDIHIIHLGCYMYTGPETDMSEIITYVIAQSPSTNFGCHYEAEKI